MIDKEEVINELVEHIESALSMNSDYVDCVRTDLLQTAVGLLKAQKPRVMTLEEVKEMKRLTVCAIEQRSKVIKIIENTFNAEYGGIVTLGTENFLDFGLYGDTSRYRRTEAGYGKTWRCWTSRPTKEQQERVKWDEPRDNH